MGSIQYTRHLPDLVKRQRFRCYYCGVEMRTRHAFKDPCRATVDHVIPRSRGGGNDRSNLVAACADCNEQKANMTAEEFRRARDRFP
jgi:5-methylcytosine-specific restriction endonuclease McrA